VRLNTCYDKGTDKQNTRQMTKEQIVELAKICGFGDFAGKEEQLLKFAQVMFEKGVEDEAENHVDENY